MITDPGTPLRLADGTLVYPNGRQVSPEPIKKPELIEVPTNREAQQLIVNAKRKLSDLPDIPKTMNVVSVILAYSLFGLENTEIALATGLTEAQVFRIKAEEAYNNMHTTVVHSILAVEADSIRDIFTQHARASVGVLVEALHDGSKGERMVAAKDLLDRGGFRPTDVVEHRHKLEGGLTIEIIKRDVSVIPTINLVLEE